MNFKTTISALAFAAAIGLMAAPAISQTTPAGAGGGAPLGPIEIPPPNELGGLYLGGSGGGNRPLPPMESGQVKTLGESTMDDLYDAAEPLFDAVEPLFDAIDWVWGWATTPFEEGVKKMAEELEKSNRSGAAPAPPPPPAPAPAPVPAPTPPANNEGGSGNGERKIKIVRGPEAGGDELLAMAGTNGALNAAAFAARNSTQASIRNGIRTSMGAVSHAAPRVELPRPMYYHHR